MADYEYDGGFDCMECSGSGICQACFDDLADCEDCGGDGACTVCDGGGGID